MPDPAQVPPALVALVGDLFRVVIGALPLALLGLLVYFLWRSVQAMPRTGGKTVKPTTGSTARWDDAAGVDEARAELIELVEFLKDPARFERLGARVPKGVLLYGPPGTGKTLLARAVAGESGASFFYQAGSGFVEVWGGMGAARIRKLFAAARKAAPAIVFIDELDAVGKARGTTSPSGDSDHALNQLLVEMDGFADAKGVIVMASTNRLESLDPALLRPGRFDRHVVVSAPDLRGRREILDVHTRRKPLAADVSLDALARSTAGLTGADLESICNEAAIRAARAGRDAIVTADFDDAYERVLAGLQTRSVISEREKRVIAYHEAGHALMSHLRGGASPVQKVTIVPRGGALGYVFSVPDEDRFLETTEELCDRIMILLAGRAAEQVVFGRISNSAAHDLEQATAIARRMVFEWGMGEHVASHTLRADNYALSEETKRVRDAEQARICDAAYADAVDLLRGHRDVLDRLAGRLLEIETLGRADVEALLAGVPAAATHAAEVGRVLAARPERVRPDGARPT